MVEIQNPYDVNGLHSAITSFGMSTAPWGTAWAIPVLVFFALVYVAARGDPQKAVHSGIFLFIMGAVAQYFIIGTDPIEPLATLLLGAVFSTIIDVLFYYKL